MNSRSLQPGSCAHPVSIQVVFQTPAHGQRAETLANRLSTTLRGEVEVQCDSWEFGLLADPYLRDLSAASAGQTDLLIICASALPEHVQLWLERFAVQRREGPVALVALLEEGEEQASPELERVLCEFAARHEMDFFSSRFTSDRLEREPGPVQETGPESVWLDG